MNAKYLALIGIALSALSYYIYDTFQNSKTPTLDSFRVQAEEARQREEEATRARLEREDNLSQALYDSCYSQAVSQTGSRFEEKQRKAYDCWREELTNTNWTGKLAPASEPPSRSITSNSSQNVTNQSTIRSDKKGSSWSRSEVQQASQTDRKSVATLVPSQWKVSKPQAVTPAGNNRQKGTSPDYWVSYETAVKLIRKWEWLRLSAYKDVKQCSIWYWFYWWKIPKDWKCKWSISQKNADSMLAESVHEDLAIIRVDFPNLHSEAHGALASFKHNCPAWYQSIRKNGLHWFNSWCKTADGERLQGLVNRRSAEWKIISTK